MLLILFLYVTHINIYTLIVCCSVSTFLTNIDLQEKWEKEEVIVIWKTKKSRDKRCRKESRFKIIMNITCNVPLPVEVYSTWWHWESTYTPTRKLSHVKWMIFCSSFSHYFITYRVTNQTTSQMLIACLYLKCVMQFVSTTTPYSIILI